MLVAAACAVSSMVAAPIAFAEGADRDPVPDAEEGPAPERLPDATPNGSIVAIDGPATISVGGRSTNAAGGSGLQVAQRINASVDLPPPTDVPPPVAVLPGDTDIADGELVITEILFNPRAVYDSRGEWFELHNTTSRTISLDGWTIGDETYDLHTIEGLAIGAGERAVLARFGDPARNGGVDADYVYGDAVLLFNVGDRIVIRTALGDLVDEVDYGDDGFARPEGASLSLIAGSGDNADGANWCVATTTMPAGDFASPGRANECGSSPYEVVIAEVLQNPAATSDSVGEWFELANAGNETIDLDGFSVQDEDGDHFEVDQTLLLAPGERAVLGTNGDRTRNGGVDVDVDYGDAMRLHNTFDELIVNDPSGIQVDVVRWDDGRTFPDPDGASMQLADVAEANDDGANWCESARRWGTGDFGSPGTAGSCDTVVLPDVIVTEIMFDPERTQSERQAEWFELANLGDTDVVLDGHLLRTRSAEHVIAELTVPAGARIVVASNGDPALNGGITGDYVYDGSLPLYNTTGVIELLTPDAISIDRVEWSPDGGFPNEKGHSIEVRSTAVDNSLGANWCATVSSYSDGNFGTPGVAGTCEAPPPPVPLRISELMINPAAVFDSDGEWFEIYNPTADPVDLSGWAIGDGGSEHLVVDRSVVVAPNGFAVIARSDDPGRNGGIEPDFSTGTAMVLINSGDTLRLTDPFGRLVDEITWGPDSLLPDPNGGSIARSMSAMSALADNGDVSQWCVTHTQYGDGDRGTPGATNDCVATPNHAIVINEIHRDPRNEPDAQGEWIELLNSGTEPVDIAGWTLRDDDYDSWSFPTDTPIVVEAGDYFTVGRNDATLNGGIEMDALYGTEIILFNTTDELMLFDTDLVVIDRVAWTAENGFPKVPGATMSLRDPALDNSVGGNWCAAVTDQGNGDLGTPGAANLCELPPEPNTYQPTELTHSIFATAAGTCSSSVTINASDLFVGSPVRTNGNIAVSGSKMTFLGPISHGGTASIGWGANTNGVVHEPGVQEVPFGWSLADFAPGGGRALDAGAAYTHHVGDLVLRGSGVTLPAGLHYVDGDVQISASSALLNEVTIVATGTISISSSGISLTPYADDLPALYAGSTDCSKVGIELATSGLTVHGAVVAPGSKVKVNASVATVDEGALVGSSVDLGASTITINRRTGFVRVTAMCGDDTGRYMFRVRHERDSGGMFPFDLRVGGTVLHSGVIAAGETQMVWLDGSPRGVKVISTGGWINEYGGTASANSNMC